MKYFNKIYTVLVLLSLHSMVISIDSVIPPKVKLPLRLVQPRLEPTMSRVGSNFGSTSDTVFSLVDQSFSALNKNNVEEALSCFKQSIGRNFSRVVDQSFSALNKNNVEEALSCFKQSIGRNFSRVVDQSLSALNNSKTYLLDKYEDRLKYRHTLYKFSLVCIGSSLIGFGLGHKPPFSSADEIRNWNIYNPCFYAYNIIKTAIAYHLQLTLNSHIDDISDSKTEAELMKILSSVVIVSTCATSSYLSDKRYDASIQLEDRQQTALQARVREAEVARRDQPLDRQIQQFFQQLRQIPASETALEPEHRRGPEYVKRLLIAISKNQAEVRAAAHAA